MWAKYILLFLLFKPKFPVSLIFPPPPNIYSHCKQHNLQSQSLSQTQTFKRGLKLNMSYLFLSGLVEWDTGLRPRNLPSGSDSLCFRHPGGILPPSGLPTRQHWPQGHVRRKSPGRLLREVALPSAGKEQSMMNARATTLSVKLYVLNCDGRELRTYYTLIVWFNNLIMPQCWFVTRIWK